MEFTYKIPCPDYNKLCQVAQITQNGVYIASVDWCEDSQQVVLHNGYTDEYFVQTSNYHIKDSLNDLLCIQEVGWHWMPKDVVFIDEENRSSYAYSADYILNKTWKEFVDIVYCIQFDLSDIRKMTYQMRRCW